MSVFLLVLVSVSEVKKEQCVEVPAAKPTGNCCILALLQFNVEEGWG